jgi:hypothetical protein
MLHPELFLTEAKFLDKKMACLEGNKYIGKINYTKKLLALKSYEF